MNKPDGEAQTRELFGHLLPLEELALLLPKPAMLEIQGMDSVALETGGPGWLLGTAGWREQRLPVVSIEAMLGQQLPARSRRSRLAVVNSLGTHLENGLFMVVIQGYPHLTALSPDILRSVPLLPQDEDVVLSRVRLANTEAVIPDLEAIERRLSEALAGIDQAAEAGADWSPSPPA